MQFNTVIYNVKKIGIFSSSWRCDASFIHLFIYLYTVFVTRLIILKSAYCHCLLYLVFQYFYITFVTSFYVAMWQFSITTMLSKRTPPVLVQYLWPINVFLLPYIFSFCQWSRYRLGCATNDNNQLNKIVSLNKKWL